MFLECYEWGCDIFLKAVEVLIRTVMNKLCSMTAEDDTSIPTEVKVPILQEFYRHVYNRDWHYSCTGPLL
jgi:hypothetical protein